MRKLLLLCIGVGLLFLYATPASAITLLNGPLKAKATDGGSLFVWDTSDPLDPKWKPRPPNEPATSGEYGTFESGAGKPWASSPTAAVDDEFRAIFDIDLFSQIGNDYYSPPDGELTGMIYDLMVVEIDPLTGKVYFAPAARNPVSGAGSPPGSGGVIELWEDTSSEGEGVAMFDPGDGSVGDGLGPQKWQEGGGPGTVNRGGGNADGYPTINLNSDGSKPDVGVSLWLQGVFLPIGITANGNTYHAVVTPSTTSYQASFESAYVDVIGGSAAWRIQKDYYTVGNSTADLTFAAGLFLPGNTGTYENGPQDIGNWQNASEDPINGYIIPEPQSLVLLGTGLMGLIGYCFRRRMRKGEA